MTIFEYLQQKGITARAKTALEYCGPCPACGGKDRFSFWPGRERYFCRGCGKSGDLIDLLRGDGMSFTDARRIAGQVSQNKPARPLPETCKVKEAVEVSQEWQKRATAFVKSAANRLQTTGEALKWLEDERGISRKTARRFLLGWNEKARYFTRSEWGLTEETKDNGKLKKLWIPRGLVIPRYSHAGQLAGLKIRRPDADILNESGSRYVFVSGGSTTWAFYGAERAAFIIVESELDAMLLHQAAGENLTPVSTGGAMASPDAGSFNILSQARHLLISMDRDRAGDSLAFGLLKIFSLASLFPLPKTYGKDHTEAIQAGLNLAQWVKTGLCFAQSL